jgi:hypothetical protein
MIELNDKYIQILINKLEFALLNCDNLKTMLSLYNIKTKKGFYLQNIIDEIAETQTELKWIQGKTKEPTRGNIELNGRAIENIVFSGINLNDYPDFCDAFIESASFVDNGEKLNDDELDQLLEENRELVYEEELFDCSKADGDE